MARVTCADIQAMKQRGERTVITIVYDYTTAQIADKAGSESLLVGDSAARRVLGYTENAAISMDEMILLSRAVVRGSSAATFPTRRVRPDAYAELVRLLHVRCRAGLCRAEPLPSDAGG